MKVVTAAGGNGGNGGGNTLMFLSCYHLLIDLSEVLTVGRNKVKHVYQPVLQKCVFGGNGGNAQ